MKNANLKKRVLATMITASVAFSGAVAVAPSASANEAVTSRYTPLSYDSELAARQYNLKQTLRQDMGQLPTKFGPGWCIDAALPEPQDQTQYQVRRLDGTSGLYGFNLATGGDLKIHPDIEKAAINLTKLMLDDYYAGRATDAKRKNLALQAIVSNNQTILNQIRGYIAGEVKPGVYGFGWARNPVSISYQDFVKWTGFEIRGNSRTVVGQSDYHLVKNDAAFSRLNVNPGEYVSILVPSTYDIYQDVLKEPTNQRIIIVAQPGLDNYNPKVVRETTTVTATLPPATTTVTKPGTTFTETVTVRPGTNTVTETTRPTVTIPQYVQPIVEETVTEAAPNVTTTITQRPDVIRATETKTLPRTTETTTVTAPQRTVTVEQQEPVTVTKTVTEQATTTVDGATQTAHVTEKAEPVTETVRVTQAPKTETRTVTAAPQTKVVETTVTSTNRQVVERTTVVERYTRKYTYALSFAGTEKSQIIDIDKLGEWKIDFIDDSNGLVKVEKVLVDGKYVLKITPIKEGTGTVRIVITDQQGNRHEYSIDVVNKSTKEVTVNDVTVNNHYFNVGVGNIEQVITVPAGWDYKVNGPGALEPVNGSSTQYKLKLTEGLAKGKVEVKVFEKVDGKATGSENNYIFNIDTVSDRSTQTVMIGNYNSYRLDIPGIEAEPEKISGGDLIQKIEKRGDFWVITPKPGATGDAVIKAVDKNGKVFTYTLRIQPGTNVLVDVETHQINESDSVEIRGGEGFTREVVSESGQWDWAETTNGWKVTNKVNGSIVVNVYAPDKNAQDGRILVGTYTIVAKPAGANSYPTAKTEQTVFDRNTLTIKRGTPGNTLTVKEGQEYFTYTVDEKGDWVVRPVPGMTGKIVIVEKFGQTDLVEHTINVEPGKVDKITEKAQAGWTYNFSGNYRVTKGEALIDGPWDKGQIKFVSDANGEVVVEFLNSRDLPYKQVTYIVEPQQVREESFTITSKSSSTISLNSPNFTYEVVGDDVLDVTRNGDTIEVKPKPDKAGTSTVVVKNERGIVIERYTYTVVEGTSGENTASSATYKLSVDGKFTITRLNNNPIEIVEGAEWVKKTENSNEWVIEPVGPDAIGKTVKLVETRDGLVVKRYEIQVIPSATPLNFKEERTVLYRDVKDEIERGKNDGFKILRGNDVITVTELPNGKLEISAKPGKSGYATIEITNPEGNLVRVVEVAVPDNNEGEFPTPKPTIKPNPDKPGTYLVDIEGGTNSVDVKICTGDGSCTFVPRENITHDGGKTVVDPGVDRGILQAIPVYNGIINEEIVVEVDLGASGKSETNKGSSDLDAKCIASIILPLTPLLLLIPVGLLSQVQIPGLEGVSAQINEGIRQANDYVQRGLGIYDRDKAERASQIQGAFQVANPEMIGLAAGSLGVILYSAFVIDNALKHCGKENASSSYQLGEATDSDFLRYGSSGKSDDRSTQK